MAKSTSFSTMLEFLGNQSKRNSIIDFDSDEFDNVMPVNVKAAALGIKHAAHVMVKQNSGFINYFHG